MRRKIGILLGLVLTMATLAAMISPGQAMISSITWIGPRVMRDYDYFYDAYVVAYETGTDWSLVVNVYGSLPGTPPVNVSRIMVWFDWGINYTYMFPYPLPQVPDGQYRAFTVSNTTASLTDASNMIPHIYTVYVEHAKNTSTRELSSIGTPPGIFSYDWDDVPGTGYKFAVYSADQRAAMNSRLRYEDLTNAYWGYSWTSSDAISLVSQASFEYSNGLDYYDLGDFANAKTSFAAAVSKFEQAIVAQDQYSTTSQQVSLNNLNATGTATLTNANANMKLAEAAKTEADAALVEANAAMVTANATKAQADAALTNAYGWYFIGIGFAVGWTLMGVGVVIYALRKPKPPT